MLKKTKKTKNDIIKVGEVEDDEEEETARIKWRDLEVYHLIAIRGEMDEEFAKIANKQGRIFTIIFFKLIINLKN